MTLSQLVRQANVHPAGHFGDAEVTGAQLDSRRCSPGTLFFCMPGTTRDSHLFLPAAQAAGASAAVVYSSEGLEAARSLGMPAVHLEDVHDGAWRLCDALFHHPTRHMKVIGVTGTNGKTTTAWILRDMLRAIGGKAAYLGTLGFQLPDEERELANTTPFTVELYNLLAEARDRGVQHLAMEVSSHALAERRADGVEFDVGVFTNLTQDHLDYHGTMEEYADAKLRLFTDLPRQTEKSFQWAINVGDPVGHRWASELTTPGVAFWEGTTPHEGRFSRSLQVVPREVRIDGARLEATLRNVFEGQPGERSVEVATHLGGGYNVQNSMTALAAAWALGVGPATAARAFEAVRPVPGRFEAVPNDAGIGILVDYAHTPDALEKLLDAVRPLTSGRIITVFGCGGDRDRTKRPLMARAASERSDITVATSDNPRTEDPQAILDDVLAGVAPGRTATSILDRREAVAYAVTRAKPGDVVVIAGKGHENYQIIGREKVPMDDRELARAALR
ncbi:MAG: UDP-N-acetylmuramoyl-L-alanyl-D-glutamate--2,6-diaminopimelate ligase [Fimbriimonas sp.]